MEQAGSVFPDLVEASMTEMRLRSKMAASCLGYSFARSQTNSCGGITASTEGRMSPISRCAMRRVSVARPLGFRRPSPEGSSIADAALATSFVDSNCGYPDHRIVRWPRSAAERYNLERGGSDASSPPQEHRDQR